MAANSYLSALKDLPANIWNSVFRNPLPHTDLGRAQTTFTNFFLHIHPVKVNRHTIKPWYTMGLGLISLFLFITLTVTGVLLMFYYVPSTTQAYDRMLAEFAVLTDDFVAAALSDRPHGFANLNDLLRELHQGIQKAHPCGAGLGLLGVSTEGDLGLCHRFVESKSHEVGNVRTGVDEAVRQDFLQRGHVDTKTDCTQCFARPLCAGGCYHEAHVRFGEATRANVHACEWIRGWTDLGLSAYARIAAGNPKFFARYETS